MVWQGKALGALIGVFAAGPVGALFGTFIGHLFDVQAEGTPDDDTDGAAPNASPAQVQEAFFRATFLTMGHLAKADGRWQAAYAPIRTVTEAGVPEDLKRAIAANPRARTMFRRLTRMNLFSLAYRVNSMRTPEGRARKIEALVAMLARGETIVPQSASPRARRPGGRSK